MTFTALSWIFCICGVVYMILTMSLATGWPPFYVSGDTQLVSAIDQKQYKERLKKIVFNTLLLASGIPVFILIYQYTHWPAIFLAGGLCGYFAGIKNRKLTLREAKTPREWVYNRFPALNIFMIRYPSGLFDLYTIGLSIMAAFIMILTTVGM